MTDSASTTVRTMCPMNCHPTLCGMLAEVRDGRLASVRGDPDNPDSRGFLCIRGQASREVYDNPSRLLHPLVRDRRTDPFRPATWDEALGRIAAGIAAATPDRTVWWSGHGSLTTSYGTRIGPQMVARFANLHGSQFLNPTMICWGLGAFGLGLTGLLETNTKEDMGAHSALVVLWAANLASQPNTARHLLEAKRRGAYVVTIDVRHTEAAAKSDEVLLIRPGTDTALALAMLHVICAEGLHDADFVARRTVGFEALAAHLRDFTPGWAAALTGIDAARIVALARRYARTRPAMIVLGGSSMHKGANGWQAARAIACLPALTGNVGVPGSGFGPRHGAGSHGRGLGDITAAGRRGPGPVLPNQMSAFSQALCEGRVDTLMLMGTNMLSSFADTTAVAPGLDRTPLVVSHDLFLNDTARRFADVVLPSTAWLEEVGAKMTATHLYLMERALAPAGETRSMYAVLNALAGRLGVEAFDPWGSEEAMIDAVLDHPCTGRATVAALRAEGGIRALAISHVAYPTFAFDTPSRRIELDSARAEALGLPRLPTFEADAPDAADAPAGGYPLVLAQGRTLAHFHSFYGNGRELPTLARRETEPALWLSPQDAAARGLQDGAAVRVFNTRGTLQARALVTDRMPAGTVWMRDGWPGLNGLTGGGAVLPDAAVDAMGFSAGQARFDARVEVGADEAAG
jgi:anaerobic selenocysteine-containing dehydrogenase